MKTLSQAYAAFADLMSDDIYLSTPCLSYEAVCARIGVSPTDLNEILFNEMGLSGPEILNSFQKLLIL